MTIFKYFLVFLSISLFSSNVLAKETKYSCKPQSAAAVRSNGIQVFKISGKEMLAEAIADMLADVSVSDKTILLESLKSEIKKS